MYGDTTQFFFPLSGRTTVPLIFEPQVLRCTAASSSGRPVRVLLDTGTDPSAIDLYLARQMGLNLGEFALGTGAATDAIPFTEATIPWLRLGELTLRNVTALALDLSTMPFHVDVVLGYNVLCQIVFHIDYANQMIQISHPDLGVSAPTSQGALLPLNFVEHFPALTDRVLCGNVRLPVVTIDTGSNGGLTLGRDLAQQLGLHHDSEGVTLAQGAGFGGTCAILRGQAESITLGPFTFHDVELDALESDVGVLSHQGRANIGNHLLSRFASITLDYGRWLLKAEGR